MSARNLKGEIMDYRILLSIIPVGSKNCITQKQLALKLNCTTSAAKLLVKIAREHHIPILSGKDGYWISESPQETTQFCNSLRKKSSSLSRVANSIDPAVQNKQIKGQLSFDDFDLKDKAAGDNENDPS